MLFFNVFLVLLASDTFATPTLRRSASVYNLPGDPEFTVSEDDLKAGMNCPTGSTDERTVLLVPGTGETTAQFFAGNFADLLPDNGFPACFLNIPGNTLGDAQITGEYVAYAVNSLALSTGGPIRVLSHSQGGLNVQWALTFFPSTRKSVASFFAIGPDYRGTVSGTFLALAQKAMTGAGMTALFQQGSSSNFIQALAKHGGLTAFVPTTNIYTHTDDLVQPEFGPNASSLLAGDLASNVAVQDICPGRIDDHFTMVVDVLPQFLALTAFNSKSGMAGKDDISTFQRIKLCAKILPNFKSISAALGFGTAVFEDLINVVVKGSNEDSHAQEEPALRSYAQ